MSFSAEQKSMLAAKLDGANVKRRAQAGRQLSYVEGWHVIAEANRIFGFDGWDRQTVRMKQLGEPYKVEGKDTWRVAYMAKVRVIVRTLDAAGETEGIIREGTGYGSGIDRDLGSAHESAIKEAETDAMKRALMTFGNPFGLALYDKEQSEVEHGGHKPAPVSEDELARAKEAAEIIRADIKRADTLDKLQARLREHGAALQRIQSVSPTAYETLLHFAELRRRTMTEAA